MNEDPELICDRCERPTRARVAGTIKRPAGVTYRPLCVNCTSILAPRYDRCTGADDPRRACVSGGGSFLVLRERNR